MKEVWHTPIVIHVLNLEQQLLFDHVVGYDDVEDGFSMNVDFRLVSRTRMRLFVNMHGGLLVNMLISRPHFLLPALDV